MIISKFMELCNLLQVTHLCNPQRNLLFSCSDSLFPFPIPDKLLPVSTDLPFPDISQNFFKPQFPCLKKKNTKIKNKNKKLRRRRKGRGKDWKENEKRSKMPTLNPDPLNQNWKWGLSVHFNRPCRCTSISNIHRSREDRIINLYVKGELFKRTTQTYPSSIIPGALR